MQNPMPSASSRIVLDLIAFFVLAAAVAMAVALLLVATVVLLAGRAEAAQLGTSEEVQAKTVALFATLESPVVNGLQLQWPEGAREGWRLP